MDDVSLVMDYVINKTHRFQFYISVIWIDLYVTEIIDYRLYVTEIYCCDQMDRCHCLTDT
jgi:hypothetical protein